MARKYPKKPKEAPQKFNVASLENVDFAFYNFLNDTLDIFATTGKGYEKVPVIWASTERAFQIKHSQTLRDNSSTLKLPLISVYRREMVKDYSTSFFTPGNNQFVISTKILPFDTSRFANAQALKDYNQPTFKFNNQRVVYETQYVENIIPMKFTYEVSIKTNFLSQMNEILTPMLTLSNRKGSTISQAGHTYYLVLNDEVSLDNVSDQLEENERVFECSFDLGVEGYIFGDNQKEPNIKKVQSFVEFKFQRERVVFGDIPDIPEGAEEFRP